MVRTQISFTEEQYEALRQRARARGISMAAVVREAVDDALARDRHVVERALAAVGTFSDEATDVSHEHDRYLADIYAQKLKRRRSR